MCYAVVGNQPESLSVSICFFCLFSGVSKCVYSLPQWSLGFSFSFFFIVWLSIPPFFKSAKGNCPIGVRPQGVALSMWFSPLTPQGGSPNLCNSPSCVYPAKDASPDPITSLHFYPIPCGSFLQRWLDNSLSASLQFVFSENCSTCRCIFDVFMGR